MFDFPWFENCMTGGLVVAFVCLGLLGFYSISEILLCVSADDFWRSVNIYELIFESDENRLHLTRRLCTITSRT